VVTPTPPAGGSTGYPTGSYTGTGATTGTGGAHAAGATAVGGDPISVADERTHPDVSDRSLGDIVGKITSDFSTLMRQEVQLAKAEMTAEAKKAGQAGGMLGGAGVLGHLALVFASLTLMFLLDKVMDIALAAFLVTLLWAIVAGILASIGRKRLKQVNLKPEQTIETLKEDAQWAKTQTS